MDELQLFGGRGGNSGLRNKTPKSKGISSADDAKDFSELSDYMQNAYSVKLDKSLKKYNFSTVKECTVQMEEIMNDFPRIKGTLKTLNAKKYNNGTNAETKFIPVEMTLGDKMLTGMTMKQYYNNGWSPKSLYLEPHEAITVHEMGHVLEAALVKKKTQTTREGLKLWNNCTEAKAIMKKAYKRAYGKSASFATIKNTMKSISRYGMTDMSEAMAECISEYYSAREMAHPLSNAVYNILKEELK